MSNSASVGRDFGADAGRRERDAMGERYYDMASYVNGGLNRTEVRPAPVLTSCIRSPWPSGFVKTRPTKSISMRGRRLLKPFDLEGFVNDFRQAFRCGNLKERT